MYQGFSLNVLIFSDVIARISIENNFGISLQTKVEKTTMTIQNLLFDLLIKQKGLSET